MEISRLEHQLAETFRDNQELKEEIEGQKVTILSLQTTVEERRRSEPRKSSGARTVRLIYKDSEDISGDEGLLTHHAPYSNNNTTPKSFLMSSSDSFEI